MGDSYKEESKKNRIKFLAGGAIIGGILGLLIGNSFLGSSVGMVVGVLWWTRMLEGS